MSKKLVKRAAMLLGAAALLLGLAAPIAAAAAPQTIAPSAHGMSAAPAVQAPSAVPPGCSSTNLCFWNNINFNDGPGQLSGTNSDWHDFSHSSCQHGTWADCVSSIFNDGTSCTARVWVNAGFGGANLTIARGTGIADLTKVAVTSTVSWNDLIEANDWVC